MSLFYYATYALVNGTLHWMVKSIKLPNFYHARKQARHTVECVYHREGGEFSTETSGRNK